MSSFFSLADLHPAQTDTYPLPLRPRERPERSTQSVCPGGKIKTNTWDCFMLRNQSITEMQTQITIIIMPLHFLITLHYITTAETQG